MFKKAVAAVLVVLLVAVVAIQFVPYGRNHANPPVAAEPAWSSPEVRALAKRACFDCHSHETAWLWYTNIAPASWLIQRDVDEGRAKLNFSAWGQGEQEVDDAAEVIQNGEMPPWFYLPLHPDASLSAAEKQALIQGLEGLGGGGHDD
jgi:hypothetical protein